MRINVIEFHTPRIELYDADLEFELFEVACIEIQPFGRASGYFKPEESELTYWRASGIVFFPTTDYAVQVERTSDVRDDLFAENGKWEEIDWPRGRAWIERVVQWNLNFPMVWWRAY